jgi:parallel beta-helix repeat protein
MRHGILIKGESIRNVAVRNCEVVRATTQGILIAAPDTDPRMAALSKEERYRLSPRDISISDTKVSQSGSVGIYVDSYAQDTKLTGVTVEHSRSAGIYLEHSSVRTRIEKSKIRYNGFRNATREGTTARREGIAIDSSANNIIVGNVISDNARGGIFLYKNCWERHDRPGTVPRWQSSSFNLITHNRIENERVGIWVASRQGKNLTSWKCGDPEIADGFYRDYADHNTISGNVIINSDVGIRIFDSNTTVVDNQTIRAGSACIEVGAPILQRLGVKIAGTRLSQNSCSLAASTTQQEFECNGNPTSDRSGETYACPPAPATKRDGP